MNKYRISPTSGISYDVYASSVEVQGAWLMFYKGRELIHACSSMFTYYVNLDTE
jgi:hypothetical protein